MRRYGLRDDQFARIFGHGYEKRDMSVRQGGDHVAGLQPIEAADYIRPCRQLVPKSRERVQAIVVLRGNAEFWRQTFEGLAVQHVEIRPRSLAPANAIKGGRIVHPPRIDKRRPIGPNAARVSPRR